MTEATRIVIVATLLLIIWSLVPSSAPPGTGLGIVALVALGVWLVTN